MSLALHGISVSFAGRRVLHNFDLAVPHGSTTAVVGPSGSGKSTLLRVIAGLTAPDTGAVFINGIDVTKVSPHRRRVGLVFQDNQLFPHLDVWHNVAFGLRMSRTSRTETSRRVSELLNLVGLAERADADVSVLSGGEAKRVALARALAPQPGVVLFDEPLTGLDHELHDHLLVELARILTANTTTAVLVTHDRAEAEALASAVVELG